MDPEHALEQFAAAHLGLGLREVYLDAGGTPSGFRRLLERGSWILVTRRLARAAAAPVTPLQQALAAVLDTGPGAVLSHLSGGAHWGVPGYDLLPADVLRPRMSQRRALTLGIGHWATLLDRRVTTVFEGVPVVTPSYLALQLFGSVHPRRAERAAATMLSMRIATIGSMRNCLDLMAEHGRDGIVRFRAFVEQEERRKRPTDSNLERRFESVLRFHGEKPMRRQVDVGGDEEWIGRIDQVDDDHPFLVEIDSARFHTALIDQEADEARTKRLEAEGFTVRRFTDDDCFHRPDWVAAEVGRVRTMLRTGQRPPDLVTWLGGQGEGGRPADARDASMADIEAVLWDFGGVFVPSPFSHLAGFGEELGTSGDRVLELVFGPYDRDTDHPWHRLERGEIGFDECNTLLITAAAEEGVELDPLALLMRMGGDGRKLVRDDVVAVAQRIHADVHYRTAIITNNAKDFRVSWMGLLDVDSICEVIVDSSEVGVRKPDPAIFHLTLERLGGVAPEATVFLDDAPGNVAAAEALGIHAIRVHDDHEAALAELEDLLAG